MKILLALHILFRASGKEFNFHQNLPSSVNTWVKICFVSIVMINYLENDDLLPFSRGYFSIRFFPVSAEHVLEIQHDMYYFCVVHGHILGMKKVCPFPGELEFVTSCPGKGTEEGEEVEGFVGLDFLKRTEHACLMCATPQFAAFSQKHAYWTQSTR